MRKSALHEKESAADPSASFLLQGLGLTETGATPSGANVARQGDGRNEKVEVLAGTLAHDANATSPSTSTPASSLLRGLHTVNQGGGKPGALALTLLWYISVASNVSLR